MPHRTFVWVTPIYCGYCLTSWNSIFFLIRYKWKYHPFVRRHPGTLSPAVKGKQPTQWLALMHRSYSKRSLWHFNQYSQQDNVAKDFDPCASEKAPVWTDKAFSDAHEYSLFGMARLKVLVTRSWVLTPDIVPTHTNVRRPLFWCV